MKASEYLNDHWAPRRVWTHLDWPRHQARLRKCAEFVVGRTAVDVGCAFGHSTSIMAGFRKDVAWAGLEFDEAAIVKAIKSFPAIRWIAVLEFGNAQAWPGMEFDSVVCSEVIEHIERPEELVARLIAVARKRVIITTPNRPVSDPGHLRVYTAETLAKVLFRPEWETTIESSGDFFFAVMERKT